MTMTDQPRRPATLASVAAVAPDAALGVVFAAGLAGTAWALADSWGGGSWIFGLTVGALVSALAIARRMHRLWTAAAGLALAAVATVTSEVAGLPREPAPTTAAAIAVLIGSAIRWLPARSAAVVVGGGLAVVIGAWLPDGFTAVAMVNSAAWLAAVAVGMSLRVMRLDRPVP
jgi:hypothetical protein